MDINDIDDGEPQEEGDDEKDGGLPPELRAALNELAQPRRESIERLQAAIRPQLPGVDVGKFFDVPKIFDAARFRESERMKDVRGAVTAMWKPLTPIIDVSAFMPRIDPAIFEKATTAFREVMPPNWVGVTLTDAGAVVDDTGWPIVWLPRGSTVEALVAADPADREAVLLSHRDSFIEDAFELLDEITWADLVYSADCAREAVRSFEAGFERSAQTFTGSILTGLLQGVLKFEKLSHARDEFLNKPWREERLYVARYAVISSTIAAALDRFYPGDPVPTKYSRHAVAHVPHPDQFSTTNAMVGLMLVVALVRELEALHARGDLS